MAIQLFGDPYNLQGSAAPLQGSSPSLQPAGSPQPAYAPAAPAPTKTAPRPTPISTPRQAPAPRPTAQPIAIAPEFASYVQTRPSPSNPGVLEYYNPENNTGFSNERDVLNYILTRTGKNFSSLSQLSAPAVSAQGFNTGNPSIEPYQDTNQALAEMAGRAGLSIDDFLKLTQKGLTPEERDAINKGLGIPDLENAIFTPPSKNTEQLYNDAYAMAGLADLKKRIQDLDTQINSKRQQFTDAEGKVNENPWLSEASRVGRAGRLNDKAQADIGNLIEQQNQLKDLYNSGIGEVESLITRQTADFADNQQRNTQKLQYLLSKAEQQVQDKQSAKTAEAYSYLPAYLKAKAAAQKPETIGSNETGYYRWNPDTQTFEQVIAPNVTPNFQANPVTGELFNTKTGLGQGAGSVGGGSISIPGGTLAARNNNPGNLRYVGQEGATQGEGGFAKFATPEAGYQALVAQIQLDAGRGHTLSSFINKYAPPSENNTSRYIQQAVSALGVSADTPISQIDINQLAAFMAKKESGTTLGSSGGNDIIGQLAQQVLQNPALLQSLPTAQQTAVIARLAQTGQTVPNQLTTEQKNKQNSLSVLQNTINSLEQLGNQIDWKGVGGLYQGSISQFLAKNFGKGSSQEQQLRSLIGQVQGTIAKERGGTSFTPNEQALLETYTPTINDSPLVIQSKIEVLKQFLQNSQAAYGGQSGSSGGSANLSDLNFRF